MLDISQHGYVNLSDTVVIVAVTAVKAGIVTAVVNIVVSIITFIVSLESGPNQFPS